MNRFQAIYDIAELCVRKNVNQAVICPGSRCAPLTLAFARHPQLETRTFSDERSAGFVALGLSQQINRPVLLLCTSGTAAYNFSPAVAEAYFSETPLVVFTADRPAEWVAQHDGQTIHQENIFGRHVKRSIQLPQDYDHEDSVWAINRIVNEAINLSMQEPRGPVHINAPFREPLYPKNETTEYSKDVRVIESHHQNHALTTEQKQIIQAEWSTYRHIVAVAGQQHASASLTEAVDAFTKQHSVPVIGDIISNLHASASVMRHADVFLGQATDEIKKSLVPDLLITFGKSVISKNVKVFLRKYKPKAHWHIQPAGTPADTFQSITRHFECDAISFLNFVASLPRTENFESQKQNNYFKLWEVEERRAARAIQEFFPQEDFAEFELVNEILNNLPDKSNLHLANSMSVRYANLIGLTAARKNITVYANRGTSGIDGCTSTVVGHSLKSNIPNVLITGDVAFFYDRNAFWHNHPIADLRVVLLNNHGGVIFGMIDGPGSLPEAPEYFITRQQLNARKLCEEFDFDHLRLDHKRKLKNLLKDFLTFDGRTKILEIETDTLINKILFDNFKQKIKKSYEF
jgi:2-succinyl-5-enolpyruvyl-6-hydroxy-3-cyclohexene-1-carboxylate synthase